MNPGPTLARRSRLALRPGGPWCVVLLLVGALVLPSPPLQAQDMTSEDRIRALRSASNDALEAHDVDGFMTTIDEDYVGTAGNGGHIRSREELRTLIRGLANDDEPYVWFVRTPGSIEVDPAGGRALETGRWVQRAREAGVTRSEIGGGYSAYWRRVDGRWRIHGEVFVTLGRADDGA